MMEENASLASLLIAVCCTASLSTSKVPSKLMLSPAEVSPRANTLVMLPSSCTIRLLLGCLSPYSAAERKKELYPRTKVSIFSVKDSTSVFKPIEAVSPSSLLTPFNVT